MFLIPSKSLCEEIKATKVQPTIRPHDRDHLIVNFTASFIGDIPPDSDIRLTSHLGRNLPIIDNIVSASLCMKYEMLHVDINGIKSEYFSFIPFTEDIVRTSVRNRTCREGEDGVIFDVESFRKESLIYDSCLKYVQLRSAHGDEKFGPEIRNASVEVPVKDDLFRVCVQMKPLAPKVLLSKFTLKNCSAYKPLRQVQVDKSSTPLLMSGVGVLLIILAIGAPVLHVKMRKRRSKIEIDQNPDYGQQECYYKYEDKKTNIAELNEEYDGAVYSTDHECYVKDSNNTYAD